MKKIKLLLFVLAIITASTGCGNSKKTDQKNQVENSIKSMDIPKFDQSKMNIIDKFNKNETLKDEEYQESSKYYLEIIANAIKNQGLLKNIISTTNLTKSSVIAAKDLTLTIEANRENANNILNILLKFNPEADKDKSDIVIETLSKELGFNGDVKSALQKLKDGAAPGATLIDEVENFYFATMYPANEKGTFDLQIIKTIK